MKYYFRILWQAFYMSAFATMYLVYNLIVHPIKSYHAIKWAWKYRNEF